MEVLSISLGILGLVATLAGTGMAYVTYVSPSIRFKWYLKNKNGWRIISTRVQGQSEYYQFTTHPEFIIEEIDDHRWERDEPWMKRILRPDTNCFANQILMKVNGNVIHTENFLYMDGGRIYVPIPKVEYSHTDKEEDNTYYYDNLQTLLAGVLGRYHIYGGLKDFCDKTGILMDFVPNLKEEK